MHNLAQRKPIIHSHLKPIPIKEEKSHLKEKPLIVLNLNLIRFSQLLLGAMDASNAEVAVNANMCHKEEVDLKDKATTKQ